MRFGMAPIARDGFVAVKARLPLAMPEEAVGTHRIDQNDGRKLRGGQPVKRQAIKRRRERCRQAVGA